jgi:hypothetical protein
MLDRLEQEATVQVMEVSNKRLKLTSGGGKDEAPLAVSVCHTA